MSIKNKLDDLDNMKGLLDVEMRENECLGRQVCNLTKSVCSPKEQEKYNIFVQDVDKIINLLLSLSGRLARVENTIQMLPMDADKQEMVDILKIHFLAEIRFIKILIILAMGFENKLCLSFAFWLVARCLEE